VTEINGVKGWRQRHHLARLWVVLDAVHANLHNGTKMSTRELWYKLKPNGLFPSEEAVSRSITEACCAVSAHSGRRCPREALGITVGARGQMTGCVTLLPSAAAQASGAGPQPLDASIFHVPGDTEVVRALRFGPRFARGARCVLVIEKETVFHRLVNDNFVERLPCVLVTSCGMPTVATRMLVRVLVDSLGVRAFALTDYNPWGLQIFLIYKLGSATFGLEHAACCPSLHWIGLRAADVGAATEEDDASGLPPDAFQPFTARDHTCCASLRRRPCVAGSPDLLKELAMMEAGASKCEIEALSIGRPGALLELLEHKLLKELATPAAPAAPTAPATPPAAPAAPTGTGRTAAAAPQAQHPQQVRWHFAPITLAAPTALAAPAAPTAPTAPTAPAAAAASQPRQRPRAPLTRTPLKWHTLDHTKLIKKR
jgi:meiotic recombination protein SPO11